MQADVFPRPCSRRAGREGGKEGGREVTAAGKRVREAIPLAPPGPGPGGPSGPRRGEPGAAGRGAGLPARGAGRRAPSPALTFRCPARVELLQFVLVALYVVFEKMHRAMVAALGHVLQVRIRVSKLPRASQPTLQNFPVRDRLLLVAAATAAAALFAFLVKRFGYKSRKFFHGCPVILSTEIHLFSIGDVAVLHTLFLHVEDGLYRVRSLLLLFMPFNLRSHYLYMATSAQPPALPVSSNY